MVSHWSPRTEVDEEEKTRERTGTYIGAEDVAAGPCVVGLVPGTGGELRRRGFAVVDDVADRRGGRTRRAGHAVQSRRPDAGEEDREEEEEEADHLGHYWARDCERNDCR